MSVCFFPNISLADEPLDMTAAPCVSFLSFWLRRASVCALLELAYCYDLSAASKSFSSYILLRSLFSSLRWVFSSSVLKSVISFSISASDLNIVPRSSFLLRRHKRALLRFLRSRYSSEGRNLRSYMIEALLTTSTSNTKSPHFTMSGFLASFPPFSPFFASSSLSD